MFSLPPREQKEQDERNQRDQLTMETVRVDSYGDFFILRPTELGQYISCFFYMRKLH
jgi:hypothetical protein